MTTMITLNKKSPRTGKVNSMDLDTTQAALDEYQSGSTRLIQDIFPSLNSDEREFIQTGFTPQDWDELFGEEELDGINIL